MLMIVADPPDSSKALGKIVQNVNFLKKHGEKLLDLIKNAPDTYEETKCSSNTLKNIFETKENVVVKIPYVQRFLVTVHKSNRISFFNNSNLNTPTIKYEEKLKNIQKTLTCLFDTEKASFFNIKNKSKNKEIGKKVEQKIEEIPLSIQDKYNIPFKTKAPSTRKPKQNIIKKQKISEKKDIKVGWLDNLELMPVKRKNLFKKKHK